MKTFNSKTAKEYVDVAVVAQTLTGFEVISGDYILRENNFKEIYICSQSRAAICSLSADIHTIEKLYSLIDLLFDHTEGKHDKNTPQRRR